MPEVWEWVTPDNIIIPLNQAPFILDNNFSGYLMPDFKRYEKWLGEYGYLDGLKVETREVFLPLIIKAENLLDAMRNLAKYFNPRLGDGKLRVTYQDGSARELICRYADGMTGNNQNGGVGWQRAGIKLRAVQPYWRDTTEQSYLFTIGTPLNFFPMLPLHISNGGINGEVTVINAGEVETWIKVTVNGPAESVILTNQTNGKTMTFPSLNMTEGDVLSINTAPGEKYIRLNGENAFNLLSRDSQLWALEPGNNHLVVQIGNGSAESKVYISFFQQYLTA